VFHSCRADVEYAKKVVEAYEEARAKAGRHHPRRQMIDFVLSNERIPPRPLRVPVERKKRDKLHRTSNIAGQQLSVVALAFSAFAPVRKPPSKIFSPFFPSAFSI